MKKRIQLLCGLLAAALLASALPVWAEDAAANTPALDGAGPAEGAAPASEAQQGQPAEASPAEDGGAQAPAQLQAAAAPQAEWGVDYETADEFTISTEAELRAFAAMVNEGRNFAGKTVKLANSIAMSGGLWVPAGSVDFTSGGDAGDRFFAGTFDGQGHTISGLVIDCGKGENDPAYDAVGLFGYVCGTIKNVSHTGLSISAATNFVGGIAGCLMDHAVISGCTVKGSISGAVYEGDGDAYGAQMGGIAGTTENTCENVRIENCVSEASLNGETDAGGIIGRADGRYEQSVTLRNCTNRGEVNGGSYHVGGIAGSADGTAITGCLNEGAVTGTYDDTIQLGNRGVGGIVGNAIDEVGITDCRNSGSITAPRQEWVGGIAGRLHQGSSVNGCTNSGAIQGGDRTGGIVGYADAYVDGYEVAGCANTGSVSGADAVGGIVGHTSASEEENANVRVTGCTNSGAVSGNSAVGGIVGDHSSDYAASDVHTAATVQGCVNTGTVPAGGGAIVGNNNVKEGKPGKVESCFWPQEQGGAVGTGAGSAGQPSDAVKNNSSYDGTGRLNTPVEVNGETKHDLAGALAGAVGGGSAANVPDALKVTVRFDANGHGTAPDAKQVVLGTQLVLPDMADADGHAFAGWQQGGRTYKAGEVCGIMADTVFTAQWNSGTQGGAGNTPATAQKPNPQTGL